MNANNRGISTGVLIKSPGISSVLHILETQSANATVKMERLYYKLPRHISISIKNNLNRLYYLLYRAICGQFGYTQTPYVPGFYHGWLVCTIRFFPWFPGWLIPPRFLRACIRSTLRPSILTDLQQTF